LHSTQPPTNAFSKTRIITVIKTPKCFGTGAEACRSFTDSYDLYFIKCTCWWMYWLPPLTSVSKAPKIFSAKAWVMHSLKCTQFVMSEVQKLGHLQNNISWWWNVQKCREVKNGEWSVVKWREGKGSEVKWRSCVKCVYYHWFIITKLYVGSVQCITSLLFPSLCYFLIIRLILHNILFVNVFVVYFCFLFFCVLCSCIIFVLFCVLFLLLCSLLFSQRSSDHCHRVETQLQ
jgi:hypothetical protein